MSAIWISPATLAAMERPSAILVGAKDCDLAGASRGPLRWMRRNLNSFEKRKGKKLKMKK